MRIIIIGGGVTGLSTAYRLVELGTEKKLRIEVFLLEGSGRVGGTIGTRCLDGFLIEEGPDSFITTKPWALSLCRRIGLDSCLIPTNDKYRRTFVIHRGRLVPVPEGFLMLAPAKLLPLLTSSLFSWYGKLRMMLDLAIPRAPRRDDESLASFVTRRLGREALERAAQPLMGGIYTADPETLSLRATMPRFLEMEEEHGSVIRAMLIEKRKSQRRQGSDSGARYSLFMSFRDGMQTLVDALSACLPEGAIQLNRRVRLLSRSNGGWSILTDNDVRHDADGVVIATSARHAAALSEGFDPSLSAELTKIRYASSAVVNLAYKLEDIPHPLDGFGFVVPIVEKRAVLACSFSSVKFAGRAPDGNALLRCFVGGALQPEIYEWDDRALIEAMRKEMRDLLHIASPPLLALVHRHPQSMAQYSVGHLEQISRINDKVNRHRGLALAGSAYGGVGIPDCIHSGEAAAEAVVKEL
jgi:protoporphyrinogen/coproporphyrinogen III oxidase